MPYRGRGGDPAGRGSMCTAPPDDHPVVGSVGRGAPERWPALPPSRQSHRCCSCWPLPLPLTGAARQRHRALRWVDPDLVTPDRSSPLPEPAGYPKETSLGLQRGSGGCMARGGDRTWTGLPRRSPRSASCARPPPTGSISSSRTSKPRLAVLLTGRSATTAPSSVRPTGGRVPPPLCILRWCLGPAAGSAVAYGFDGGLPDDQMSCGSWSGPAWMHLRTSRGRVY